MARSILCPRCGVSLNLPEQALGRRVKCPKCAERFFPSDGGPPPSSGSVATDSSDQSPDSTMILTKKMSSFDLPALPQAAGNLRETFDLPLMSEAAVGGGSDSGGHANRQTGDAVALFDDKPAEPRRKRGAEARANHRRCPTCGGYVPQGMSLCGTCGLDLDTGTRFDLTDDLNPAEPVKSKGIPLAVGIVGGICMALAVVATLGLVVASARAVAGAIYFIPVGGFAIYAATQFLRLKNARLLLVALSIGAVIDLTALVALPIYYANVETKVNEVTTPLDDDPDVGDAVIQSVQERLDLGRVESGIAILGIYAALSIFIISPVVQKHFHR